MSATLLVHPVLPQALKPTLHGVLSAACPLVRSGHLVLLPVHPTTHKKHPSNAVPSSSLCILTSPVVILQCCMTWLLAAAAAEQARRVRGACRASPSASRWEPSIAACRVERRIDVHCR